MFQGAAAAGEVEEGRGRRAPRPCQACCQAHHLTVACHDNRLHWHNLLIKLASSLQGCRRGSPQQSSVRMALGHRAPACLYPTHGCSPLFHASRCRLCAASALHSRILLMHIIPSSHSFKCASSNGRGPTHSCQPPAHLGCCRLLVRGQRRLVLLLAGHVELLGHVVRGDACRRGRWGWVGVGGRGGQAGWSVGDAPKNGCRACGSQGRLASPGSKLCCRQACLAWLKVPMDHDPCMGSGVVESRRNEASEGGGRRGRLPSHPPMGVRQSLASGTSSSSGFSLPSHFMGDLDMDSCREGGGAGGMELQCLARMGGARDARAGSGGKQAAASSWDLDRAPTGHPVLGKLPLGPHTRAHHAARDADADVAGSDVGRHVGDGLQPRSALPAAAAGAY